MISAQRQQWLRYYTLFQPLAYLPLPLAYHCANRIGARDAARQAVACAYIDQGLQRILPVELYQSDHVEHYFKMLARETLDVFVMARLQQNSRQSLINLRPDALAVLHNAKTDGRGVIIAMSHYSRINMLLLALALAGERLGMLTMTTDKRNTELDPVTRQYLNFKIGTLLRFIQGRWIMLADDMRSLYRALEQGETMVLLLDSYTPERIQKKLSLPFLGGHLAVSRGIVRLAQKTGAQIVYGVPYENGWRIEASLRPLSTDPEQALHEAIAQLEQDILKTPWAWWHWNIWDAIWTPAQ